MKILIIIGTRPEAIKMAILYKLLRQNKSFDTHLCTTGQHTDLLSQALNDFNIKADTALSLDKGVSDLGDKMASINIALNKLIRKLKPDSVIVQGDTLSAYCGAITAKLNNVHLCHIEAGLRSGDKSSPFPEEMLRQLIARLADMHFAPSIKSKENLISEGIDSYNVFVTGNTGIDALVYVSKIVEQEWADTPDLDKFVDSQKQNEIPILLLTMHRRENVKEMMDDIFHDLYEMLKKEDYALIFVGHPHFELKNYKEKLASLKNVKIIEPIDYRRFIQTLFACDIVLTDSGGLQEESAFLGKPGIVLRKETERVELLDDDNRILYRKGELEKDVKKMLKARITYATDYGIGKASESIVEILNAKFGTA